MTLQELSKLVKTAVDSAVAAERRQCAAENERLRAALTRLLDMVAEADETRADVIAQARAALGADQCGPTT